MRLIERNMLAAIYERKDWSSSNTRTECTYFAHSDRVIDRIIVYLHNSPIARITPTDVTICDCGYQTSTTKSRLNAILHELCGAGIYQKNYRWYATAEGEQDWEIDPRSEHCFFRGE